MPSPKPFARSGIFFPPKSRTATTKMTKSSGKPIDRNLRPPYMDTLNCRDVVSSQSSKAFHAAVGGGFRTLESYRPRQTDWHGLDRRAPQFVPAATFRGLAAGWAALISG